MDRSETSREVSFIPEPFSTLTDAQALAAAGYGRTVLLEVIATSPGYCLVRTHYINTEGDVPFQNKEPFIEVSLDFLADKMGHAMLMVASLQAQLKMQVNAPDQQTYATLANALAYLMKIFAAEYGVQVLAIEEQNDDPVKVGQDEVQALGQEFMQKVLAEKAAAGILPGQHVILLKDPVEVKKFMAMLGSRTQKGGCSCGHPDCTGKR